MVLVYIKLTTILLRCCCDVSMWLLGCSVLGSLIFSYLVMQKPQDRMLSNVIAYLFSIHLVIWCINNMHFWNGAGRVMLCHLRKMPEVPWGFKWILNRNLHTSSDRESEMLLPLCHFSARFLFSICNILFPYSRRGQVDHGKIIRYKKKSRHQESLNGANEYTEARLNCWLWS